MIVKIPGFGYLNPTHLVMLQNILTPGGAPTGRCRMVYWHPSAHTGANESPSVTLGQNAEEIAQLFIDAETPPPPVDSKIMALAHSMGFAAETSDEASKLISAVIQQHAPWSGRERCDHDAAILKAYRERNEELESELRTQRDRIALMSQELAARRGL